VKVSLLITDLNVGGAEKAMVSLAMGLDRNRWQLSVINLGGEEPLAAELRRAGFEVTCLGVSKRKPVKAVRQLAAALREQKPQILQCFMFHANVAGRLAAVLARVPWVLGGLRVAEHEKSWHLIVDRLTNRLSSGSVCVSEGVRRFSVTYGGLPESRLTVIPNGVNIAVIDAASPIDRKTIGMGPKQHIALFVGRLDAQKGLPYLLDAAEIVAAKIPNWHLVMIGREGSESDWFRQRLAESPALTRHVHWLGFRSDVAALLKASDVMVLPSLWEGMPNVVLEAMACARAVIGTDVEGTNELVIPGQTGWLVPPETVQPLADALLSAATEVKTVNSYGKAGRERVEKSYSLSNTIQAYDKLWTELLGYTH
jgi:starch synthase (maltosyl-transferring)